MNLAKPRTMLVAGVMSGTSADGVDVALCRIAPARNGGSPRINVLAHRGFAYDKKLRTLLLAAAGGEPLPAAEFARLSWRLGETYADCIEATARDSNLKPQLIACHGQTIYHQGAAEPFLGKPLRCTWQTGEAAVIAERLHVPVISDLRSADLAAGGQGAPLVPMLDFCVFRHATKNRLLLNLGGIANITTLPAACAVKDVLAFDTGPASMVIDASMQRLYNRPFDRNGAVATRGRVLDSVLKQIMTAPYLAAPPPKSCGREQYGPAFVEEFLALCNREGTRKQDVITTATAFTVETILHAYRAFCWPHLSQRAPLARTTELFAAGGGARNATLMRSLTTRFAALGVKVSTTAEVGVAVEAKEAAAFALMGWLTWHGMPGNIPSATGAAHAALLGKVTLV